MIHLLIILRNINHLYWSFIFPISIWGHFFCVYFLSSRNDLSVSDSDIGKAFTSDVMKIWLLFSWEGHSEPVLWAGLLPCWGGISDSSLEHNSCANFCLMHIYRMARDLPSAHRYQWECLQQAGHVQRSCITLTLKRH